MTDRSMKDNYRVKYSGGGDLPNGSSIGGGALYSKYSASEFPKRARRFAERRPDRRKGVVQYRHCVVGRWYGDDCQAMPREIPRDAMR